MKVKDLTKEDVGCYLCDDGDVAMVTYDDDIQDIVVTFLSSFKGYGDFEYTYGNHDDIVLLKPISITEINVKYVNILDVKI